MYGGGALLIRELARRSGGGWPTIIVLGLAYSTWEEALVTQLLFNPTYHGLSLAGAILPGLSAGGEIVVVAVSSVSKVAGLVTRVSEVRMSVCIAI